MRDNVFEVIHVVIDIVRNFKIMHSDLHLTQSVVTNKWLFDAIPFANSDRVVFYLSLKKIVMAVSKTQRQKCISRSP